MAAILLQDVSFRYPGAGAQALSSVNLEIPEGSFFALLGPNGAGKTTLLRLLCGRFAKFDGTVDVAEPLRSGRGVLDMMRCGVLLENPGIYPKLSIEEYLSYFAGFYGMGEGACLPGGSSRERAEMLASRLGLANLNSRMGTLSLGNRQKVQVLRALLPNPKLLILDEPVANLDPVSYAFAGTSNRDMKITIDKGTYDVAFPPTGSWDKWDSVFIEDVWVDALDFQMTIASTTNDGGPNIDMIAFDIKGVYRTGCKPAKVANDSQETTRSAPVREFSVKPASKKTFNALGRKIPDSDKARRRQLFPRFYSR